MQEQGIPGVLDQSPGPVPQSESPRGNLRRPIKRILLCSVLLTIFAWAICLALKGGADRRMTIRTNLDNEGGPLVIVDGQELGVTQPVAHFTFYPGREIRLIKDGDETVTAVQPSRAPWSDSLPPEVFVENLCPFTPRDEKPIECHWPPPITTEELLQRAEKLRTEVQPEGESRSPDPGPIVSGSGLVF